MQRNGQRKVQRKVSRHDPRPWATTQRLRGGRLRHKPTVYGIGESGKARSAPTLTSRGDLVTIISSMTYERPNIRQLHAYVPGEQPQNEKPIKLNTNENPYPPGPAVLEAIHAVTAEQLRRYPSPRADRFREAAAKVHGLSADQIIATNGGDELLRLAITVFCEPAASQTTPAPTPAPPTPASTTPASPTPAPTPPIRAPRLRRAPPPPPPAPSPPPAASVSPSPATRFTPSSPPSTIRPWCRCHWMTTSRSPRTSPTD